MRFLCGVSIHVDIDGSQLDELNANPSIAAASLAVLGEDRIVEMRLYVDVDEGDEIEAGSHVALAALEDLGLSTDELVVVVQAEPLG